MSINESDILGQIITEFEQLFPKTKPVKAMKITEIHVFKGWDDQLQPNAEKKYSASVAIDDKFMIQLGTDGEWNIPHSNEACWNDENEQDKAHENFSAADLVETLNANERVQHLIDQEIFDN